MSNTLSNLLFEKKFSGIFFGGGGASNFLFLTKQFLILCDYFIILYFDYELTKIRVNCPNGHTFNTIEYHER